MGLQRAVAAASSAVGSTTVADAATKTGSGASACAAGGLDRRPAAAEAELQAGSGRRHGDMYV